MENASLAERVAKLEGEVNGVRAIVNELNLNIRHPDQKVDRFRDELSNRITAVDMKVDRFREELSNRIEDLRQEMRQEINNVRVLMIKFYSIWGFGFLTILMSIYRFVGR